MCFVERVMGPETPKEKKAFVSSFTKGGSNKRSISFKTTVYKITIVKVKGVEAYKHSFSSPTRVTSFVDVVCLRCHRSLSSSPPWSYTVHYRSDSTCTRALCDCSRLLSKRFPISRLSIVSQ